MKGKKPKSKKDKVKADPKIIPTIEEGELEESKNKLSTQKSLSTMENNQSWRKTGVTKPHDEDWVQEGVNQQKNSSSL